eukprot:GFYU01028892.1.p1 GENE.GFYU01028892.1~~GFYU01028892.1.p1  ORF type:complete len:522 (+),score=142.53 GFYU01028892.1:92-1567(+)
MVHLVAWGCVIVHIVMTKVDPDQVKYLQKSEVWFPLLMMLWRYSSVAGKYALMPAQTYRKDLVTPRTEEEARDMLLIPGWGNVTPTHMMRIAQSAYNAVQVDHNVNDDNNIESHEFHDPMWTPPSSLFMFTIHDGFDKFVRELKEAYVAAEEAEPDCSELQGQFENHKVPARYVVAWILMEAIGSQKGIMSQIWMKFTIPTVVYAFLPSIIRAVTGDPFIGASMVEHVVSAFAWVNTLYFMSMTNGIIAAAYTDAMRRLFLMSRLSHIISGHDGLVDKASFSGSKAYSQPSHDAKPLTISLRYSQNVSSWIQMRTVFCVLGRQFATRIGLYVSLTVFVVIMCGVYLVVQAVSGDIVVCTAAQVAFLGIYTMVILASYVLVAADVNRQTIRHKALLLRHQRECELAVSMIDEYPELHGSKLQRRARRTGIQNASRMLDVALEQVEVEQELYPLTFLGATADGALAKSMVTVTASVIPLIYGLMRGVDLEELG